MKLRPVVASLMFFGVISSVFAANQDTVAVQQMIVDQNSVVSPVASDNWFNRISIGGVGTLQGVYSSANPPDGTMASNSSSTDFYINNLNLLIGANLNSWAKASVNLLYFGVPYYDLDLMLRAQSHKVIVDEAYVTFANLAESSFYAKIGKQYVDFGTYDDPYNYFLTPLTQAIEQTNQTAVDVGFVSDFGPYASVYAFEGNNYPIGATSYNIRNYGARAGWVSVVSDVHYNINLDWIRDSRDNYSSGAYGRDPVGAIAAHLDISYQQLVAKLNYFSSLSNQRYEFPINTKISAGEIGVDYLFKTYTQGSKLGLDYQRSANAGYIPLYVSSNWYPKSRWQADYKVNLMKNVDADFVYAHNKSYDVNGSAPTSNIGLAKLMVQF